MELFIQMLKLLRRQIENVEQRRKRRVKEEVVLPDPGSHCAYILRAEITEKPLLLEMPSKSERGTKCNNLVSPFLWPSILPSLFPNGWNYLEAREQEHKRNAVPCKPEQVWEGWRMASGQTGKRLAQCGDGVGLINEL